MTIIYVEPSTFYVSIRLTRLFRARICPHHPGFPDRILISNEQANLIRSVPNFIKSIQNDVQAKDFHLLTIDTDEKGQLGPMKCTGNDCTCSPAPDCCEFTCFDKNRTCNGYSCEDEPVVACDTTLGAGKRMHATDGASCNLSDDRRYFTHNQPNPADTFSCVASVSTSGDGNERPIAAMLAAFSKEQQDDDGCNAGFLRKDSLLVATIISDEDETAGEKSGGTPQEWKDALVAAKGGIEEQVVVIGIIGDRDANMPLCPELDEDSATGAGASPRLRQFVEPFGDNGLAVSVFAEDYAPYFAQAVGVVDFACDKIPK